MLTLAQRLKKAEAEIKRLETLLESNGINLKSEPKDKIQTPSAPLTVKPNKKDGKAKIISRIL